MSKFNILFKLTGSIACYKACQVVSRLAQDGHTVQIIATPSVYNFVGRSTLEGLSGRSVLDDTFQAGHAMEHIELMRWANLVVLCPASANTVGKMANGIADNLVSTLFLAHDFKKPYLLVPAMNTSMYEHPATQSNLERLSAMGVTVLSTGRGALACGETGWGRMLEPEDILKQIRQNLNDESAPKTIPVASPSAVKNSLGRRLLITGGGTSVPIDQIRKITNTSTGATSAAIADQFALGGWDVTALCAKSSVKPLNVSSVKFYETYEDLEALLFTELENNPYDLVIHAAAVSDFKLDASTANKMPSSEPIVLKLVPQKKLLNQIKQRSKNPSLQLVAFKLTVNATPTEIENKIAGLIQNSGADFVVHNELSEVSTAGHKARIYSPKGPASKMPIETATNREMASALMRLISKEVPL